LDDRLAAVAPRTALLAAKVTDGRCEPVHGVSPRRVMPLASGFKLYVLGALAHAVRRGAAGWDEPLAIRDDWKSLPSGEFQTFPAGTTLPLREYANAMISISDNTATDHLMGRLGRARVEAQQFRFAMAEARRNAPFLTTRELFVLKLTDYPRLARTFERLPNLLQRFYLAHGGRQPAASADRVRGIVDHTQIDRHHRVVRLTGRHLPRLCRPRSPGRHPGTGAGGPGALAQ
jgi:hypothetical protein